MRRTASIYSVSASLSSGCKFLPDRASRALERSPLFGLTNLLSALKDCAFNEVGAFILFFLPSLKFFAFSSITVLIFRPSSAIFSLKFPASSHLPISTLFRLPAPSATLTNALRLPVASLSVNNLLVFFSTFLFAKISCLFFIRRPFLKSASLVLVGGLKVG